VAAALSWVVLHAEGRVTQSIGSAFTIALYEFATYTPHLERTVKVFVDHYNNSGPHRSLGLVPPNGRPPVKPERNGHPFSVRRSDRLGELLLEYDRAA
jgi:hypothetical protein